MQQHENQQHNNVRFRTIIESNAAHDHPNQYPTAKNNTTSYADVQYHGMVYHGITWYSKVTSGIISEFKDVVFEDVVFDNDRSYLILYFDVT